MTMIKTIDMKLMRYINLFARISKVTPLHCFIYNFAIILIVPKQRFHAAIGRNYENLRRTSEIIGKKIKVVACPSGVKDAERFISTIIYPVELKSVEMDGNYLIINADQQSKAILIGRNKQRLEEMKKIVKEYFDKELKIV